MNRAARRVLNGEDVAAVLEDSRARLGDAGFSRIDYFALVNALTLEPVERAEGPMRLIAAAVIGRTRLIDNIAVGV